MAVRFGRLATLLAIVVIAVSGACSDNVESGSACQVATGLCPDSVPSLRDTVISPIIYDTTLASFPAIGQEAELPLASRGDSLETRVILRYDSLPKTYRFGADTTDSTIRAVQGSAVVLKLDSSAMRPSSPSAPIRIDVYDVYDSTVDTVTTQLLSLFRPDRLLASRMVSSDSIADSVRIALPDDSILAHIQSQTPLRLGFRVSSSESIQLEVRATNSGFQNYLHYSPVRSDTNKVELLVPQVSRTPSAAPFLALALRDFMIVARAPSNPSPAVLQVGGIPVRRAFARFNLPSRIVDSMTVVRAILMLTQRPNRASPQAYEKLSVGVVPVLGTANINDVYNQALLSSSVPADSLFLAPADSGLRSFEMVHLLTNWAGKPTTTTPRAVVIKLATEDVNAGVLQFFSSSADPTVAPRLRLTYIPRSGFGLP